MLVLAGLSIYIFSAFSKENSRTYDLRSNGERKTKHTGSIND